MRRCLRVRPSIVCLLCVTREIPSDDNREGVDGFRNAELSDARLSLRVAPGCVRMGQFGFLLNFHQGGHPRVDPL